jgi:hypothetical protein
MHETDLYSTHTFSLLSLLVSSPIPHFHHAHTRKAGDSLPAHHACGRAAGRLVTKAGSKDAPPTLTLDLNATTTTTTAANKRHLVVTHYSLRHYSSWDTEARIWMSPANDDSVW